MNRSARPSERQRVTPLPVVARMAILSTALLTITGCGGESGEEETATENDEVAVVEEDADGEPDESEGASGDQGGTGNYARVTIGPDTFEVPPDDLNLCNSLENLVFGSFAVGADGSATQAGGPDAATQINFGVPVSDWEDQGLQPPSVNVDLLDDGVRWFASVERGLGSVDSWTLADGTASGQATFEAEEAGSGTVIGSESGTFEIVCR